mmetsp:Transcript_41592/g.83326  ORF Transcript_41592/g.83326 Transcript_41592/m.83326 type:complete len:156 (+) Transcript_41592:291-758(+)
MSFSSSPAACHDMDGTMLISRNRHSTAAFKGVADRVHGVRSRTSTRHFSHEVADCLDDVDFGVPKLKDVEDGLPKPFSAGKILLRRSEVKSERKRWNGDKDQSLHATGASEVLSGALRMQQPNVATIVTRSQSAKMLKQLEDGVSSVDQRSKRRC